MPGFVCVLVLYIHETAPVPMAIFVGVSPAAWLMFPEGSRAWAPQLAPALVVAETSPYRDALITTERTGACVGDAVAGAAVTGATEGARVGRGVTIAASIAL